MSLLDLQKTKETLTAIDSEIEQERAKFEASIAELLEQKAKLEVELTEGLKAELASLGGTVKNVAGEAAKRTRVKIDDDKIIAALKKAPGSGRAYIFDQLEGRTLGINVNSLSQKLAKLVDEGVLVREGEKNAARYSVKS